MTTIKERTTDFLDYLNEELFKAHDSVIRKTMVDMTRNTATIEFSAEDSNGWINIEIEMKDILEYHIGCRTPHDLDVMSGGVEYDIFDENHFFDFCVYSNHGEGVARYRSSLLYFACKSFTYKMKEYSD